MSGISRRDLLHGGGLLLAGAAGAGLLSGCGTSRARSDHLTLWWDQGFLPTEAEAIKKVVADWERHTGKTADLQIYPTAAVVQKAQSAIQIGKPPDILFTDGVPHSFYAQKGLLADVSEVVEKLDLTPAARRAARIHNAKENRTSYYVTPLTQKTTLLFYWRGMLEQAGMGGQAPPSDWTGFWEFWKRAQRGYQANTGKNAHAFGWPLSTGNTDVFEDFRRVLVSYDVPLINEDTGALNLDGPGVRDGIIKAVGWLTDLYRDGFIPPGAVTWLSGDNNASFLNKTTMLTVNATLSVPMAVKQSDPAQWPDVVTLDWPQRAIGGPLPAVVEIVPVLAFDTPNQGLAKDFLSFMTRPETISPWVATQGRNVPTYQSLLAMPEWANSTDPSVRTAVKALSDPNAAVAWIDISPEYHAAVQADSLWGNVLGQVATGNESVEDAVDFALDGLRDAFAG